MTIAAHRISERSRRRGGPLVMLVLLLAGWSTARAVWWESPFAPMANALDLQRAALAEVTRAAPEPASTVPAAVPLARATGPHGAPARAAGDPRLSAANRMLQRAALHDPLLGGTPATGLASTAPDPPVATPRAVPPPFLPPLPAARPAPAGRWSVDAWAFWRQGSNAAPVSQGRVPIYGASQVGGVLQYRIAPATGIDPRLYARAYRAMVRQGENELALGASLRPFGRVPLRAAAEVRYTDAAFSNQWRPAAYVVTEIAPVALPYEAQLEAYGQAGWVGGTQPTAFADGQASITRELPPVARLTGDAARLSLGAGIWGGAQKDAQRIDIGPTLRLDVTLGEVPARISIDWRQQVAGDAAPRSGVAVTLATGF